MPVSDVVRITGEREDESISHYCLKEITLHATFGVVQIL